MEELGIEEKTALLVLNKVDACSQPSQIHAVTNRYPNAIAVSAHTGKGLDRLELAVSDALSRTFQEVDIETSVSNGKLMAYLAAHGDVLSKQFNDDRVTIHCRLPQKFLGRIQESDTTIRQRGTETEKEKETETEKEKETEALPMSAPQSPTDREIEDVA